LPAEPGEDSLTTQRSEPGTRVRPTPGSDGGGGAKALVARARSRRMPRLILKEWKEEHVFDVGAT
jgi:hypothetical protein